MQGPEDRNGNSSRKETELEIKRGEAEQYT